MDDPLLVVQRFARTQLFEDVVHPGQRQLCKLRLLPLPVRVQRLTQLADLFCLGFGRVGEGEGFEAAGFVVTQVYLLKCPPAANDPSYVRFDSRVRLRSRHLREQNSPVDCQAKWILSRKTKK